MKDKTIKVVFSLILFTDLVVIGADLPHYFRYITKPAITIVLLAYVWFTLNHVKSPKYFLMLALIFSMTGDILLLFPAHISWSFIGGLFAFLLAHIMYISAFFKFENFRSSRTFFVSVFLLFYALLVFKFIGTTLEALLSYVILYMVVLLLMVLTAFVRNKDVALKSYVIVLLGALLFMISDTLLAFNKFFHEFALADILIMFTYGWAQFLIIFGAVQHYKRIKKI